ncbi:hypothetical protein [Pseudoalteromonas ulvae]|uniref:Uncharacterized protein n=1 Tax=Pseudoalteromonas ulvae TaxID=107327 RepID=A0A2C9ZZC3_PSEDV|nr:hypothetical protein [Pseudoalteromonas ulvae]OUL56109.1 hypothetical protein B1199_18475 [Pseudoalteromonas ulvae]
MNDIEKALKKELCGDSESELAQVKQLKNSVLIERAIASANKHQGVTDLAVLGTTSLWIVFINLFTQLLKPTFNKHNYTDKSDE